MFVTTSRSKQVSRPPTSYPPPPSPPLLSVTRSNARSHIVSLLPPPSSYSHATPSHSLSLSLIQQETSDQQQCQHRMLTTPKPYTLNLNPKP